MHSDRNIKQLSPHNHSKKKLLV